MERRSMQFSRSPDQSDRGRLPQNTATAILFPVFSVGVEAMHVQQKAPYGEWRSPVSAALVAQGSRPLAQPRLNGADIYWLEGRASEGGRTTLLCARRGGVPRGILLASPRFAVYEPWRRQ